MKRTHEFAASGLASLLTDAAIFIALLTLTPSQPLNAQIPSADLDYVPDEVLVQFRTSASEAQLANALQRGALAVKEHLPARGRPAEDSGLVLFQTKLPVLQAIAALQNHPAVEYAEPNVWLRHQAVSNDPQYTSGKLWGMYGDRTTPANQYGSQAGEAWDHGNIGSDTIYVGVIDEGIDISHPDLAANIGMNPGEIPDDGIDNDGNGFIDDVYGWDFFHKDKTVFDGGDADGCQDNHGTHVSGTIGGVGGNGMGVAGMCWNVRILSGKFLGPQGGASTMAAQAIDYFVNLKTRANNSLNIVALNNSWGSRLYSRTLHEAIIRAANAGIVFVAAAGNSRYDTDTTPAYPACYTTIGPVPWVATTSQPIAYASWDAVISVAALDSRGRKANFSNYGIATVDLGAPGVNIISTVPGGGYASYDGTSMASPHVTGACVLYAAIHPELDLLTPQAKGDAIKQAILSAASATPTSALTGKTVTGGRLNVGGF